MIETAHNKVLVAMSGGVDSSASALVLLDAGYDVCGITFKLFNATAQTGELSKDAEDARRVCEKLGIPHVVEDFTQLFAATVISRFCNGYLSGETPNPCIDCNRHAKFAALQQMRQKLGYDYMATGHYARCIRNTATGRYELKRGLDANKDQSYVLSRLEQDVLAHTLFPLGELTKPQVRELARRNGFVNADKPESQDICFIKDGDYAGFIQRQSQTESDHALTAPGPIVNREGETLGTHRGLIHYTIGQRKGIGIAYPEPLYVFKKDAAHNTLVVDTDSGTLCSGIEVRDVNFVSRVSLNRPEHLEVKTHYRQNARSCVVEQLDDERIRITFDVAQRACAPGQTATVYQGDTVVCGGTIDCNL